MVVEIGQPGVLLTGRDCALIERALREGLAVLVARNGASPAGVQDVLAAIFDAAVEFRMRNQVGRRSAPGSATNDAAEVDQAARCEPIELTTTEVAQRYGCSASYVRRLIAVRGAITARRTSSGWLVDAGSAAAWAADRHTDAA